MKEILKEKPLSIIYVSSKESFHSLLTLLNESEYKNFLEEKELIILTSSSDFKIDKKGRIKVVHYDIPDDIKEYLYLLENLKSGENIIESHILVNFNDFEKAEDKIEKLSTHNLLKEISYQIRGIFRSSLLKIAINIQKLLIEYFKKLPEYKIQIQKYNILKKYLLTTDCRYKQLLSSFGSYRKVPRCKVCDNCTEVAIKLSNLEKIILSALSIFPKELEEFCNTLQGKGQNLIVFKGYGKARGTRRSEIERSIYNLKNLNLLKIKRKNKRFFIQRKIKKL